MGTNESWLSVRGTRARVAVAVAASYEARGATCVARSEGSRPKPKSERPDRLAVAVVRASKGWVHVVDSRRSPCDLALAQDLSGRLKTTVFREEVVDTASYAASERFGPPLSPSKAPPPAPRYADLEPDAGAIFLVFEGVTARVYEEGPLHRLSLGCEGCGCPIWSPGYDVPLAPEASQLFRLARGTKPADAGSVLIVLRCNECRAELGFGEAELEEGLIVEVKALRGAPTRRSAFDWALVSQRREIEALLPRADPRKEKLALAMTQEPRAALSGELQALRMKATRGQSPPLAWVFAQTREQLIAAFEAERRNLAWKPVDLPGKIEDQLLTGLGSKFRSAPVAAFLARIKGLLGPSSFARQGRDPETLVWTTAVGFQLPDESWAALLMLD